MMTFTPIGVAASSTDFHSYRDREEEEEWYEQGSQVFSRKPADVSFCFVFVFCVPNRSLIY